MFCERTAKISLLSVILFIVSSVALQARVESDLTDVVRKEVIRRNPSYVDARIEIELKDKDTAFEGIIKQNGQRIYRLDFPENRRLAGNVYLTFSVYEGGHNLGQVYTRSSIKIYKRLLTSAARIKKGTVMTTAEISYVEKDLSNLPSSVIFDVSAVAGKETITFIPQGTVLLDWMFRQVPLVKKGDTVDVFKSSDGIKVSVKALCLADGYAGKTVKVRNLSSDKIIEGIVRSSGEVEAL